MSLAVRSMGSCTSEPVVGSTRRLQREASPDQLELRVDVFVRSDQPTRLSLDLPPGGTPAQLLALVWEHRPAELVGVRGGPADLELWLGSAQLDMNQSLAANGVHDGCLIECRIGARLEAEWELQEQLAEQEARDAELRAAAEQEARVREEERRRQQHSITVVAPGEGEHLSSGDRVAVSWAYTGNIEEVDGVLSSRSRHSVFLIVFREENCMQGQASFVVPAGLPRGSYNLRVRNSQASSVEGVQVVSVNMHQEPQSITVTAPTASGNLSSGDRVTVSWAHTGNITTIDGVLDGQGVWHSLFQEENCMQGQASFVVPPGLPRGSYNLRVRNSQASSVEGVQVVSVNMHQEPMVS